MFDEIMEYFEAAYEILEELSSKFPQYYEFC